MKPQYEMSDLLQIKKELRDLKKDMKKRGIRVISCFNGGLSSEERSLNNQIFSLKAQIHRLEK